jgi:hypothetical protein
MFAQYAVLAADHGLHALARQVDGGGAVVVQLDHALLLR